ncbi:DUF6175 family protein [Capnocytophaga sputigena]|jgi:hypothetical protein|uniref:DUF6175 family protein n=1 Tax=Capnocytophaga sputigena TaxID=1019 RepID=UPI0028D655F4|nr:DUF6175 family protein [Capnocytophaga sputigena]
MKKILFLLFIFGFSLNAQNKATDSRGQIVTVQPKIMVIPFVKEGEDIRTILEEDADRRIAITKIKEGFDNRGFTTVDFTAKLKSVKDNSIFTSDNQTDLKTQIVEMSGADIYVQSEIVTHRESSGNSIKIILTGYEVSTGNSLSNKVCESGKFYTDDFGRLASKAVESCIDDFLNVMQTKFTDIVNNGKSIIVDISFAQSSQHNTSSDFNNELFSDLLESWMEENAFKNNYHIQGTTDLRMIFDDVKIPLKDQNNGRNYNPNKFASLLIKYLKGLGLEVTRDIKGNTIFITIK